MADATDVARMNRIIARVRSRDVLVREVPDWTNLGLSWTRKPVGIIDHHDASSYKSGEWGALSVIVYGRPDVPRPLANWQVGRSLKGVPRVAIVAAGIANHAGRGGPTWFGPTLVPLNAANQWTMGVEKANDGLGETHTDSMHYATDVLFWAILDEIS